jgi:hypothetical protein
VSATVPTIEEFQALAARVANLEAQLATTTAPSPWLNLRAASEYLGLSEHATRKFLDRHGLDKHQHIPGGRILIHRDHLDNALDDRKTPR